jgi:hypothetical protein
MPERSRHVRGEFDVPGWPKTGTRIVVRLDDGRELRGLMAGHWISPFGDGRGNVDDTLLFVNVKGVERSVAGKRIVAVERDG